MGKGGDEAKGLYGKYQKISTMPAVIVIKSVVMLVLAIVSIYLATKAYNTLDENVQDVSDIFNNWQETPVKEYAVVSGNCPTGFDAHPVMEWRGLSEGACACPQNAILDGRTYSSAYTSCNTNQTSAGCRTDPSLPGFDLDFWRNRRICVRRQGEPAHHRASGTDRPRVTQPGQCPSGYVFCGRPDATYEDGLAHCAADECPVTTTAVLQRLSIEASSFAESYGSFADENGGLYASYDMFGRSNDDGYYDDFYALEHDDALPIVDVTVGFRTPCVQGDNQRKYEGRASWSIDDVNLDYPGSCSKTDSRFLPADEVAEVDVLRENFLRSRSECAGLTAATWSSVDVYSTSGGSYNCATAGSGGGCAVTLPSGRSCASGDNICQSRTRQSKCGQYHHIFDDAAGAGRTMSLFFRRQILWQEGCPSYGDMVDKESPLSDLRTAQFALYIINTIMNVLVILCCIMFIQNAIMGDVCCVPYKGEEERVFMENVQNKYVVVFKLIKFIPLIWAIVVTSRIVTFFADDVSGCGDEVTEETFDFLGNELPNLYQTNIGILVVDIIMLALPCLSCIFKCCCGGDEDEADKDKETTFQLSAKTQPHVTGGYEVAASSQPVQGYVVESVEAQRYSSA